MLSAAEIRHFAADAAALLRGERELAAFEVYCSSGEQVVARLNFTGDIACRGVEEVKSIAADGFAVRVVMRRNPHETASASIAGELSMDAVRRALTQAMTASVIDPHFPGLPSPSKAPRPRESGTDPLLIASHLLISRAAWGTLEAAMREVERRPRQANARANGSGLIIGGDFTLMRERIAVAGSAMEAVRIDQDAYFTGSVTTIVESFQAKATASAMGRSNAELQRAQNTLGRDAVRRALDAKAPLCPPSGKYRVILGPQPLGEIFSYMVMPSLTAGAFYRGDSAYQGRFGSLVMDPRISLIDDPGLSRGAIRRRITCEGMPTSRTVLIRDGRLAGLLSNFYDSHRLAADVALAQKLGPGAPPKPAFANTIFANNGYRIGEQGRRSFDSSPHTNATNVWMKTKGGVTQAELIRSVRNGIYVGRVWYTYPINGQRAGDFTCTVSGDSYLIENGRLAAPIAPNCLRINAHIDDVFGAPAAVGALPLPSFVWGQSEAFYLPALVVDQLPLTSLPSPV